MGTTIIRSYLRPRQDPSFSAFTRERMLQWDRVANQLDAGSGFGHYYQRWLSRIYQFNTSPGCRVLEIGCSRGDLLASLKPSLGVGIDSSKEMIVQAKSQYPYLNFLQADGHELPIYDEFDYVILSDLVNDVWDVQSLLEQVRTVCSRRTRLIINSYSKLWEQPLRTSRRLKLSKQVLEQNWLTVQDIQSLLMLTGFEVIRHWPEMIFPLDFPMISNFANRILGRLWPFTGLAITNFIVARMDPFELATEDEPRVSVIIPARNEAGNVEGIMSRVPEMGSGTELIFVEGHSTDETYNTISRAISNHPDRDARLLQQTGQGKGDAVRMGFSKANGDLLLILDADMTVAPETLPRFYQALVTGKAEFINGVRLVYPREERAMRFANLVGNKIFSWLFSWLLGQPIKDTLCGTKGLWTQDYQLISENRQYFGDFDPFGDFDLLFGASKIGLKIVDMPIRYRERTYGETNIQRWQHGLLLLRMAMFALMRLKFA